MQIYLSQITTQIPYFISIISSMLGASHATSPSGKKRRFRRHNGKEMDYDLYLQKNTGK